MSTFFKTLGVIFTILSIWAAILQNNDPDALIWYSIYGVAALASLLFVLGRLPFIAAAILFLAYLVGSICAMARNL